MPTYVYRREDGTTFEIEQRITEPALEVDPETGQPVKRVISGAGLIFKGSGFYLTDYARSNGGEKKSDAKPAGGASESTSGTAATKPEKAAAATSSKAD